MSDQITSTEAAHRAGMSRERLVRRLQVGEIEGQHVAGRWLVDGRSLEGFLGRIQVDPETVNTG